ncbi:hypothetical protein BDZ97DRAFT_1814081 [Flammula alnicola]|nr:hypothetical protein BDZ97DRAFT_1814081 [Flammula alnicola]
MITPSENWDGDFEFQPENNNHAGGSSWRRPVRKEPGIQIPDFRKLSTASTTLEDWDAEEGPSSVGATQPTSGHPPPETPTENWDDDFEDARNSPKKRISTPAAIDKKAGMMILTVTRTTAPSSACSRRRRKIGLSLPDLAVRRSLAYRRHPRLYPHSPLLYPYLFS